jgi:SAM-dependent methyltransferase
MSSFEAKTVCILGRQPALGLAELESIYGAEHVRPLGEHALLDIPAEDINFKNLGGTIKVARLLNVVDSDKWPKLAKYLADEVPEHIRRQPDGKFTFGLSVYGFDVPVKQIERTALEIKKLIKNTGRPVRVVPNKTPALNSAQVLHNQLTYKGAWELIYIKDGAKTLLAQTLFVQDIEAYGARDQARPARDARVGMLPPKLAQIMINLACGQIMRIENTELSSENKPKIPNSRFPIPDSRIRVLDPFCGTGVILQEALLIGYSVIGTDIDERMVDYSRRNIKWLFEKYPSLEGSVDIEPGDATTYKWPGFSAVASEVYLGRPMSALPPPEKFKQIVSDTNQVIKKFLENLHPQVRPGHKICIAVPAWRKPDGGFIRLPLIDHLTDMGYTYCDLKHVPREELVYFREDQVVARQLLRLKKA